MNLEHSYCRALDARFTLKGTSAFYAPDQTFDTEHIRLELDLDIPRETLTGRCVTRLKAITADAKTMVFDAVNFKIRSVKWDGRSIAYTYKDGKLTIESPRKVPEGKTVEVEIGYKTTRPKLGLYFIKPSRSYPKKPTQIWTQGEDEYARHWFPCHDAPHERTTTEIIATVPKGFIAVSNGRLVKTTHRPSKSTYHWSQEIPHATYLVTLTAGRFSVIKDAWRGIPVEYYCEKGREKEAERAFSKTPQMLEYFSKAIGTAYPFPKYAQIAVADFIYGGMENTSATTQTDTALLDERVSLDYTSDELVAHELAHQWFGDYLTCKDWSHAWLNESFATYFDALFKRHDKGEDEYRYQIWRNAEEYLHEDRERYRRPIVTNLFRRPTDLFDRHLYEKGSVVLSMLHKTLGEKLFWKSIAVYVRRNKGRVVETPDLINAIQEATGRNMRQYFDEWVYGAGHPEYRLRAWWDAAKREMSVRLVQTNADTTLFHVDAEFLFLTTRGEKRFVEKVSKKSHLFQFKLDAAPQMVLFDPDNVILKKVQFPKPVEWLTHQLFKDKNPIGRIDAARALAKTGSRDALEDLRRALLKEKFWAVRAEVALAIGQMASEESTTVLLGSLDVVDHPKVRRAIYSALRHHKSQRIAVEIEKRFRKEPSYFVEAEGLRLLGACRHPRAGEYLKDALKRDSWNEIIRSAALEGLAATKSEAYLDLIMTYTRWGQPHRLRMAAIRCLAEFGNDARVHRRLIELTRDPFLLVQITAVRVLQSIGDERAVPALKKLTAGDLDGRALRLAEEAIDKITKGFE